MSRAISRAQIGLLALALGCATEGGDGDMGDPGALPGTGAGQLPMGGTGALPPPVGTPTTPTAGAAGASAGDGDPTVGLVTGAGGMAAPPPVSEDDGPIPEDCQGFPLLGIKHSPGGSTLPNKCKPFHPTTNNPYAVRCIDAMPGYDTGFPGDEYCILPPPPELGTQVGFFPQGPVDVYWDQLWAGDYSGYQNPSPEWVLEPGGEVTQNYRGHAINTTEQKYYRIYYRMRTGSHHNIITLHASNLPDQWITPLVGALPGGLDPTSGGTWQGILGGQQRPDDSVPFTLDKPADDAGLYSILPANSKVVFNLHHFNVTDGPILREGWVNMWWETDAVTVVSWYMGMEAGQLLLSMQPGETRDLHYYWPIPTEMRLLNVFGHRHAWTPTFSSWIERAGGAQEVMYQSFDWFDMPTYRYDSVMSNPKPDPATRTDGAASGVVKLHPGDQLHFNCHVAYTAERAAEVGSPMTPEQFGPLRFANEAYDAEMCIQFGTIAGGVLGLPLVAPGAPPDFAR